MINSILSYFTKKEQSDNQADHKIIQNTEVLVSPQEPSLYPIKHKSSHNLYLLLKNKANNVGLNAPEHIIYNCIRGKSLKHGFTAITNKRKLSNGMREFDGFTIALNRITIGAWPKYNFIYEVEDFINLKIEIINYLKKQS